MDSPTHKTRTPLPPPSPNLSQGPSMLCRRLGVYMWRGSSSSAAFLWTEQAGERSNENLVFLLLCNAVWGENKAGHNPFPLKILLESVQLPFPFSFLWQEIVCAYTHTYTYIKYSNTPEKNSAFVLAFLLHLLTWFEPFLLHILSANHPERIRQSVVAHLQICCTCFHIPDDLK